MSSEDKAPVESAARVEIVQIGTHLRARIDGDFSDEGPWEFAFYLMHGKVRSATRWYTSERTAEFPLPSSPGKYHVTGFARRSGASQGWMGHSQAIQLRGKARNSQASHSAPVEPFVLVKSYYGLGGDLCVLLSAWRFAESRGRKLVVDWTNGFYGEAQSGSLFHSLFDEPALESISAYRGRQLSVYPSYWAGRVDLPPVSYVSGVPLTLSRPEDVPAECSADCIVITRDSRRVVAAPEEYYAFAPRLRPAARIMQVVDSQLTLLKQARYSIGVHYRHGNGERTVIPPDPAWFLERIRARVAAQGLSDRDVSIYVATDCGAALAAFRSAFPRTVALPKEYRPNGAGPLHNGRDDLSAAERPELAEGALADMYALAACDAFVGSLGYFSLFVRMLRAGASTDIYDGPRVFTDAQRPANWRPLASDEALRALAQRRALPLDGLFVEDLDGVRRVRYYDMPMLDISPGDPAGIEKQFAVLEKAVRARRLY